MRAYLPCLVALSLAVGCHEDDDSSKVIPQPVFGAADSRRGVEQVGTIAYGEEVVNGFYEDLQFKGFQFAGERVGVITAEVTQRGTSRGLDTTLFVYGMRSSSNWERIDFDDDSGWGPLSKVTVELDGFSVT